MRRNWSANRILFLVVSLFLCSSLIGLSALGVLAPLETIATAPLNILSGVMTRVSLAADDASTSFADVQELRQRNAELETTLAELQGELVELREIASDYERLADLLDYTTSTENREYITADIIGQGQFGLIRSVIINKGTRDGLALGMPVVTELGLVGRIRELTANAAQVQLITDSNSFVSGRVQSSRAEGIVQGEGLQTGSLEMLRIDPDADVSEGDLVVTSGLGGNFPPDIVIGQVTSVRNLEFELSQEAQVTSLVDFSTLEFVLVVTSFEPADISVFDEPEDG
jgi:rod shape-determining protein MreC